MARCCGARAALRRKASATLNLWIRLFSSSVINQRSSTQRKGGAEDCENFKRLTKPKPLFTTSVFDFLFLKSSDIEVELMPAANVRAQRSKPQLFKSPQFLCLLCSSVLEVLLLVLLFRSPDHPITRD